MARKTSPSGCLAFWGLDGLGGRSWANCNEISGLWPEVFRVSGAPKMREERWPRQSTFATNRTLPFQGFSASFLGFTRGPLGIESTAAYVKTYNIYRTSLHSSFPAPD
jgi:hypothetical protein